MNPGRCKPTEERPRYARSTGAPLKHAANLVAFVESLLITHCLTLTGKRLWQITLLLWRTAARTHWKTNSPRIGHVTSPRARRSATTPRPGERMIRSRECEDIDPGIFLKTFLEKNYFNFKNIYFEMGGRGTSFISPESSGHCALSIYYFFFQGQGERDYGRLAPPPVLCLALPLPNPSSICAISPRVNIIQSTHPTKGITHESTY